MKKMMIGLTALAAMGAGCTHFPTGQSLDKHMFVSTPHLPMTLTLVDTYTGETVWTLDVPIYKKAVIDLDHDDHWTPDLTPAMPATRIKWGIFEPDSRFGQLENEQDLSGNPVMIKVSYRDPEEFTPPGRQRMGEAFRDPMHPLGTDPRIIKEDRNAEPQKPPAKAG